MAGSVTIVYMFTKIKKGTVINTCSNSTENWSSELSPFLLGPCPLWGQYESKNMENGWQFSKVYKQHLTNNVPNNNWLNWAKTGWADNTAHRYPMGKGAKPEFSYWNGRKLNYIEARKAIYGPLYAKAVQKTDGFKELKDMYESGEDLILRDWDGRKTTETMDQVLNNPSKKMGHAFILKMLLENDPALEQLEL